MEIAKKVDTLEAELAAKSSRIADLEARVSLLEADNARLRKAVRKEDAANHTGKDVPTFGRLEEGFGGNKQKPVDTSGEHALNDVIDVSDSEEEGVDVDVRFIQAKSAGSADDGVPGVPTPTERAVRVVAFSDDEDDAKEVGGRDHGSVRRDANVGLDDDDVSVTPRGKKRAAARVIDEDEDDGGHGNEEVGDTRSRKRVLLGMSDTESGDGGQGVRAASQEHASPVVKTGLDGEEDHGELYQVEGCSTPAPRRSARLLESQPKRSPCARRKLELVEPEDHEESEDDSEEDDSMDGFIVDDTDCTENSSDSAEESSAELEESDSEENHVNNEEWDYEADMLSKFDKHPELTLKAVCALYRKQTKEERAGKATIVHNKRGFSQIDAPRGSHIAQFLLDGDASGPLKKTAQDLEKYDRYGLVFCLKMAFRYSKQLFTIYKNKEDPYFP